MPVNSVIARPQSNETVKASTAGTLEARGYALPQGSHGPVVKVEVSTDDGKTWTKAHIKSTSGRRSKWSWALWEVMVQIEKGHKQRILSRATDAGGNVQNDNPGKW